MEMIKHKFVATKLIELLYETDKNSLISVVSNLNFLEETTAIIKLKKEKHIIKESLAQNIIRNLPLSHYEDYFSITDWFSTLSPENNPMHVALVDKNFQFIDFLLNKVAETNDLNGGDKRSNIIYNQILGKILSFPINTDMITSEYTIKETKEFYSLWMKSLSLVEKIEPYVFIVNNKKNIDFISNVDSLENINGSYWGKISSRSILRASCEEKNLFVFFAKIMNEANSEFKNDLKELDKNSYLELAFSNNNKKVVDFFIKEEIFTPQTIKNIIKKFNSKIYLDMEDSLENNKWILSKCLSSLNDLNYKEIPACDIVRFMVLFKNDKDTLASLVDKFPQIKTDSIVPNGEITLNETVLLKNIMEHFKKELNIDFPYLSYNKDFIAANKLSDIIENENFNKKEELNTLSKKINDKTNSTKIIEDFYKDITNILGKDYSPMEIKMIINKELLSIELDNTNQNQAKKLKI